MVFAGRLGGYKYYDMDKAIDAAFDLVNAELGVTCARSAIWGDGCFG